MRFILSTTLIVVSLSVSAAFTPSTILPRPHQNQRTISTTNLFSSVKQRPSASTTSNEDKSSKVSINIENNFKEINDASNEIIPLTGEEINARLNAQLEKLREKDRTSKMLAKEDLVVVFEDDDIIVVDKPSGVLTVAGKEDNPNLAKAVYDIVKSDLPTEDHMVVHRLGMDTSGLIVLAKTKHAVRKMNEVFRSRKVERQYEALVVGHVDREEGLISLPIMRDYEFPPYVRISTDDHQRALLDLKPEVVGKKILEAPKESITKYEVVSREEIDGNPVTRVKLTSISGRYHQLNVHLAAFGHPIVGDTVYGIDGSAVSNGGLRDDELDILAPNPNRACSPLQATVAAVTKDKPACVHAKYLKFQHPISGQALDFNTESSF